MSALGVAKAAPSRAGVDDGLCKDIDGIALSVFSVRGIGMG